jgi:GT2 family glycosyltransferase/SAM-dependent methyltransferase
MNQFLNGVARAVGEAFDLPGPVLEIGSYQVEGQEQIADLRSLFPARPYIGIDARPGPGVDQVADVEALPHETGSVGTVIALSTFEHVQHFWRGLDEVYRVLRSDGALFMSCPFCFHIHNYPSDYWRFTPEALEVLLRDYPNKILGWHGPPKRPINVWAIAFREDRPPVTEQEFERYRQLLGQYAHQPIRLRKQLRYRAGRLLFGRRPFGPYLEQSVWGTKLRTTAQPDFDSQFDATQVEAPKLEHAVGRASQPVPARLSRGINANDGGANTPPPTLTSPHGARRGGGFLGDRLSKKRDSLDSGVKAWENPFLEGPIDVSVCIANWNCREHLRACLESIHYQRQGVRLETIVVDNGSDDGAADMVERDFPEVVLHRNEANLGFSRANNQAARLAHGRYLFFLNNDTALPEEALRGLVEYADAHPEVGVLGPRLRDGSGRLQVSYRMQPTLSTFLHRTTLLRWTGLLRQAYHRYRRWEFDPDTTRPVEVLMGAAMFIPRQVFFDAGGWDEDFTFGGEDAELSARIGRNHPLVFHPAVEITHFGRASTRRHIGFATTQMMAGFARYLRKCGYSRGAMLLFKTVVTIDAPVSLVAKGIQCVWRRTTGQPEKAEKSLLAMRGAGHFLISGLIPFWKA